MLHWIKYFPLALWDSFGEPGKPYFSGLRPKAFHFGESLLRFKTPPNGLILGGRWGEHVSAITESQKDNLLERGIREITHNKVNKNWSSTSLYFRRWYFQKPWLGRVDDVISFSILLIGPTDDNDTKFRKYDGLSFLNPRVFESVLSEYLEALFGHNIFRGKCRYRAPVYWSRRELSQGFYAADFEVHKVDQSEENPIPERYLFFPVSENRFVEVSASFLGARRSSDTFSKLCDYLENILNTFHFTPSDAFKAEMASYKKQGIELTENFPPLKWPPEEAKAAHAELPQS